jgi:dTMP kinase
MAKGVFIAFEGPEGSGKSTQAARLAARLEREGVPVTRTREPGGTATGEAIRGILQHDAAGERVFPECEALLFAACRAQLARLVIEPALARGGWVICDRYMDSTTAYQGYGRGLDMAAVRAINALAVGSTVPDLTLLLDIEVRDGLARLQRGTAGGAPRALDRIEREAIAFHERVRAGYLDLARQAPARYRVVRTDRGPAEVEADVWAAVVPELARWRAP